MYRRFPQGKQRDLMVVLFVFFIIFLCLGSLAQAQTNPVLPIKKLTAGMHVIQAEIAATPETRTTGLMNRKSLAPNHGMLFVFENSATHCFWMRNTKIPLAIAFLADDGKIVNIEEMQAETTNNHCPKAAVRFALEMNKQWFSERVIVPGTIVTGLPKR